MFPIGDDNSDRTITPIVNYAIIGLNILVFVLLQGFGNNDSFTYAFSLVPKEITTGIDISGIQIVRGRVRPHRRGTALCDAAAGLFQLHQLDVHARKLYAYFRKYAFSVDLRRQS